MWFNIITFFLNLWGRDFCYIMIHPKIRFCCIITPVVCIVHPHFYRWIRFVVFLSILSAPIGELISSDSAKTLVHYGFFFNPSHDEMKKSCFYLELSPLVFFVFKFPVWLPRRSPIHSKWVFLPSHETKGKRSCTLILQVVNLCLWSIFKLSTLDFFFFFD